MNVSLEVQWLTSTFFFRAPITISAGCRLILSVREAAAHHGSNPATISAFVARDGPREEDSHTV